MNKQMLCTVSGIILILLMSPQVFAQTSAEPIMSVKHYQSDERYIFGLKLLDLALSQLDIPYDIHRASGPDVNEGRGERQLLAGRVDLQWLLTTPEREDNFIAVRVPIYRGLLGLRLLLVSQTTVDKMSKIRSLSDLRNYTGGHGRHWTDLSVFAANNIPVVTNVSYEALFKQLKIGDFDYFHRGINEICPELARHDESLAVADGVMLFYPNPVYFFVNKDRPELAERIERGLNRALENGSYKKLFLATYSEVIEKSQLPSRSLIRLQNSTLSPYFPKIDTSWWLPKKLQGQFSHTELP
jgi:hypothetical protein